MKIQTGEQYDSTKELGYLLEKLNVVKDFVQEVIYEHGGAFEECDRCGNVMDECSCNDERHDHYCSDDDSFE